MKLRFESNGIALIIVADAKDFHGAIPIPGDIVHLESYDQYKVSFRVLFFNIKTREMEMTIFLDKISDSAHG